MLYEDEDPLSNSMFGDTTAIAATSNSILGNTMTSSIFSSSQYQEEDPWGNYSSITESPTTTTSGPNRSFTTPNLSHYNNTTSDAAPRYNATTVLCKSSLL